MPGLWKKIVGLQPQAFNAGLLQGLHGVGIEPDIRAMASTRRPASRPSVSRWPVPTGRDGHSRYSPPGSP